MTWLLIKLGIRLVVFTGVFFLATRPRRSDTRDKEGRPISKPGWITIEPRWAIPVVGLLFGGLNILLYWILRPVLDIATLRSFSWIMPLIVNALLLWGTTRIVSQKRWVRVDGYMAAIWLAIALTVAHGVLWFSLDYLPPKL